MHDARVYCIKQRRSGVCIIYDWADDWLLYDAPSENIDLDLLFNYAWQIVYYPHLEDN